MIKSLTVLGVFPLSILAEVASGGPSFSDLTSLGAAGIIAVIWYTERRHSVQRERELTEAHARIIMDHESMTNLIQVLNKNTESLANLTQRIGQCPLRDSFNKE